MRLKTCSLKNLILLTIGILISFVSAGCHDEKNQAFRIGVSQCSDDDWRDKMNEEINREMLFHDDATVEIRTANDDNDKQISDIQYFIDNKFDIIIAAPNQAAALTPILKKAYDSGIPVVIFDRGVIGDSYTSFIEFDNKGIGLAAADYAARNLKQGAKVIEITGLNGSTPARDRHTGFAEGLKKRPDISLVAVESAAWKEKIAERVMDSLYRIYPDVDLVYAQNDLMAIGVSHVLTKNGRRDVMVLGTDAARNVGMQAVIDSVIDATFIYPTDGHRLIQTAMSILKGMPYKRIEVSPALPPVDKWNADILMSQDELLKDETHKIQILKAKNDEIRLQHKNQTSILYLLATVGILLLIIISGLLWTFRQRMRYQKILTVKNSQLEEERDKQNDLYQQLEDATKSKLTFFTNVSHDLRTPLTLITGPVEQLSTRQYLTPQDRSLLDIASKNIKILHRLIDQILDFRKYETGMAELSLSEVRITEAVRDWSESFRSIAEQHDIRLEIHTECSGNVSAAIDVEKIERVFFNLLSNAFKYSPDNSKISITCALSESKLRISVQDRGVGIKEEDKEKIFDRFFQVDKVRPNGSGIGLSLAKAFVELHGGTLSVEGKYGEGSIFTIEIPVRHTEGIPLKATPVITEKDVAAELTTVEFEEKSVNRENPLLLVIDDNPDIRQLTIELLSTDYNVITASDGRQGVRLATKFVPDLIICDIMMPVMDGLECCRLIKNEISTSHIPVLMLTACRMDEQRMQSYDSGADGYLSKPFNPGLLISRCRNLLENRKRIRNLYSPERLPAKEGDPDLNLNDSRSIESEFYNRFISILRTDFTDASLTTETLAAKLGLGPAQLTRKIKALTNYSPTEILKTYRLKKARQLIISSEKNISEIAYEVGFSSPPYLSKCFKDTFGESPSDLRNRLSKE